MRVLWSWPHPNRPPNGVVEGALAAAGGEDEAILQAEVLDADDPLVRESTEYRTVRDLPPVPPAEGGLCGSVARARALLARGRRRRRLVDEARPDVVVLVERLVPERDLVGLRRLGRRCAVVAIVRDQRARPARLPGRAGRWLLSATYRGLDGVVAYHEAARRELVGLGVDPDRVSVVPHPTPRRPTGPLSPAEAALADRQRPEAVGAAIHPSLVAAVERSAQGARRSTATCRAQR